MSKIVLRQLLYDQILFEQLAERKLKQQSYSFAVKIKKL